MAVPGISPVTKPRPIGHEYVGVVEQVGAEVTGVQPGQFVVGPFFACDNTCPHCRAGFHSVCEQLDWYDGCQSELLRVPLADGTLVAAPSTRTTRSSPACSPSRT